MKAIVVTEFGDREALEYRDVPRPEPGQGEVLVKVAASGVNFVDIYHRKGLYPGEPPFVLGTEMAGTVAGVGPGVTEFREGDNVACAQQRGTYAEYVVAPADRLVPVPDLVTAEKAAAVILQGMTAHYLSHSTYPLQEGDKALIHAAAGGVGSLLVQMAKMRGAWVAGTASTQAKMARALELGADEMIQYTEEDFVAAIKRLTDGQGVNVVYDSVGKDTFDDSLDCLRPRGYMVLFGQASGPVPPTDPQILNRKGSLYLTRPTLGNYVADREELLWRARDLFDWIGSGKLEVTVDRTFPLAKAADAHRYMEDRRTKGKLLLVP